MKRKLLEKHNRFIAYLLAILGVGGACTFGGCEYGVAAEYGTPNARFIVHGTVSSVTNETVPGIQVIMQNVTNYSQKDGSYEFRTNDFPSDQNYALKFEDIDGDLNGAYQSLDTVVSFVDPKFKNGDGHWYSGETSKELNIKLKPKN